MPDDLLEAPVGENVFQLDPHAAYTAEGWWVRREGDRVRIGLSDVRQHTLGDMAFVDIVPVGTSVDAGDEVCSIETVEAAVSLPAPVSGTVREVNPDLDENPEWVNEDPYGAGWLAILEPRSWATESAALLSAAAYLAAMRQQAEEAPSRR